MRSFQKFFSSSASLLDFITSASEKSQGVYKWLNNVFYVVRNLGIRISFSLNDSCFDDDDSIVVQDYVMLVKIPFQKHPSVVNIEGEDCWDRFSTNVLWAVLKKLRRYYRYTDPNNIPPCRRNLISDIEEAISIRGVEECSQKVAIKKEDRQRDGEAGKIIDLSTKLKNKEK